MAERPLTPKQVLAVNHMTTGCCRTYTSCATHVGIGRHTIGKWARQPQFQEAIDRASQDERKKVATDVLETALRLGGPALREMHNAIQDPSVPWPSRSKLISTAAHLSVELARDFGVQLARDEYDKLVRELKEQAHQGDCQDDADQQG